MMPRMFAWFDQFRVAPEPLSRLQRRLAWAAALLVTLTRIAFASRSLWDWDEALFSYAMIDYDVTQHHPHPPGFPLFIALARLVRPFVSSEFAALQGVSVIGAIALFPIMLLLGREMRMPFATAFAAASLLVFFPNVWFYGGTGFSDVPSLALVLLACALLLRGCRSGGAYVGGAFILAVSAGFRPQNLLVGLGPALLATWCGVRNTRSVKQVLLAIVVGAGTLVASYGGAALATDGWQRYSDSVSGHGSYIQTVDSFRNASRPGLLDLFDDFFIRPYRMAAVNFFIATLSAIALAAGLLGKRKPVSVVLLMFGPFSILGWLMLDRFSVGRFSVAWMPMIAFLAAEGASVVADLVATRLRGRRARSVAYSAIVGLPVLTMILWALPGLILVHTTDSPPVQAIEWIKRTLPRSTPLYVHGSMGPHATLLLRKYPKEYFDGSPPLLALDRRQGWVLTEGESAARGAQVFSYPRRRLRDIVRRRYFDVSVMPFCSPVNFGEGWLGEEGEAGKKFRWMGARRATALLPAAIDDQALLALRFHVPLDAMSSPPMVTITLDGAPVDRFVATRASVERSYVVAAPGDRWHELALQTDRVINLKKQGLGDDSRDLGLRLDAIAWSSRVDDCWTSAPDAARPAVRR